MYTQTGEFDLAIADYNAIIRLKPQFAIAFINRGFAYEGKGDRDQAHEDFKKAYALGSRHQILLQKLQEYGG